MELKKTVRLAMLLSLGIVLNLVESMIPFIGSIIPGLKLGLTNIVILLVLYLYGFKDALTLSIMRVFIIGILRTGLFNIIFFFSLSGALFSVLAMAISKRLTKLSIIGISIIGALFHSFGQIIIAILYINMEIIYYLPWLLLFSLPTGFLVGKIANEVLSFSNSVFK
ncbi:MAG: Gx transporter family protein [Bacilli bacterium]